MDSIRTKISLQICLKTWLLQNWEHVKILLVIVYRIYTNTVSGQQIGWKDFFPLALSFHWEKRARHVNYYELRFVRVHWWCLLTPCIMMYAHFGAVEWWLWDRWTLQNGLGICDTFKNHIFSHVILEKVSRHVNHCKLYFVSVHWWCLLTICITMCVHFGASEW